MFSVNTNFGALVALQNLNATNKELSEVQNRINTGQKVASAKDDGAVYAIAQAQRGRVSAISAVQAGIDRAMSTVDLGLAAGTAVADLLTQMKEKAVAAQSQGISAQQRASIQADFDALRQQISRTVNTATFNGANLVNGDSLSGGANAISVLMSDLATSSTGGNVQTVTGSGATAAGAAIPSRNALITSTNASTTVAGTIAANDYMRVTVGSTTYTTQITATTTINDLVNALNSGTGGAATATYNETTGVFQIQGRNDTDAIAVAVNSAQDGSGTARLSAFLGVGNSISAVDNRPTSNFALSGFDLKVGGVGALSNASTWDLSASAATAQTVAGELDTAIVTVNSNLATMGAQAKALSVQKEFLTKLSDQIQNNIGQLVDADLAKESARLQALQIKQQLGAQALSIANQQPSILLSFFRG